MEGSSPRSLRSALQVPEDHDVSAAAAPLGFTVPVLVSRRVHDDLLDVWSPCACEDCEAVARNVHRDRVARLLKSLRHALEHAPEVGAEALFTLDLPVACGERRLRILHAALEARNDGPHILVRLQAEPEGGPAEAAGGADPRKVAAP